VPFIGLDSRESPFLARKSSGDWEITEKSPQLIKAAYGTGCALLRRRYRSHGVRADVNLALHV
jgi:hypothetical protein